MTIQVYTDPELFLDITGPYLLKHETENNLLLGVLAGAAAGEYAEKLPFMALVQAGTEPELVVMCTPPYPVVFAFFFSMRASITTRPKPLQSYPTSSHCPA